MSYARTTLAATLLTLIALPLFAPSDASAYGFAAAKGRTGSGAEVYEWCTRSTVGSARACALDKCNDTSASACKIVRDCSDGKWSGRLWSLLAFHRGARSGQLWLLCALGAVEIGRASCRERA